MLGCHFIMYKIILKVKFRIWKFLKHTHIYTYINTIHSQLYTLMTEMTCVHNKIADNTQDTVHIKFINVTLFLCY